MSIITEIRSEYTKLRKEKSPLVSFCSFVISEVEKVGKNNGNRDTTEDEAIQLLKKMKATIEEVIAKSSEEAKAGFNEQVAFISKYLPKMASVEDVEAYVSSLISAGPTNKGAIMKAVKQQFGQAVDMKVVSQVVSDKGL